MVVTGGIGISNWPHLRQVKDLTRVDPKTCEIVSLDSSGTLFRNAFK
jgi:hypothetical protein